MKDGWKGWMGPIIKGLVCYELKYLNFIVDQVS